MRAGLCRLTFIVFLLVSGQTLCSAAIVSFVLGGTDGPNSGLTGGNEVHIPINPGSGGLGPNGITFDTVANTISIDVMWGSQNGFADLNGLATSINLLGPATENQNGALLLALNGIGTLDGSPTSGGYIGANLGVAQTSNANHILAGSTYLSVRTTTNQIGEIRGQLIPVAIPEPGTLAFLSIAMALSSCSLRRRREVR